MEIITATSTEMKNNFGKYLELLILGHEIIITKNGKEVGRMVPKGSSVSFLTDSLTGIIKGKYDLDKEREKDLKKKYGFTD